MSRLLLIDNYDSFTWNLYQALAVLGAPPVVHRNDRIQLADVEALAPSAIVLSPGPGRPEDAGITGAVVSRFLGRIPLLGICLGHQALGAALGGRVVRSTVPRHGKPSPIHHHETGLFSGLPNPFVAGRYHSLMLDRATLPARLQVTAWTTEGEIMAVADEARRAWGLQFHPESVLTPDGPRLLAAFLRAAAA